MNRMTGMRITTRRLTLACAVLFATGACLGRDPVEVNLDDATGSHLIRFPLGWQMFPPENMVCNLHRGSTLIEAITNLVFQACSVRSF